VRTHGGGTAIVKPLRSAGTDGVHVVDDAEAAAEAAAELLRARTIYGHGNSTVLVQQYLDGDEYMVNCLSVDGHHTVTEVWRSVKVQIGSAPVYDYTELVPAEDPEVRAVVRYVGAVLDALGTRWGPSHTEVILTGQGPLLVESAARPQGTIDVSAVTRATGRNPVVDAVHAMIDPELYAAGPPTAPVRRAARGVSFICPATGRLRKDLDWARVRALDSFHSLLAPAGRAGEYVTRTCDLFNRPGAVYLVHDDPAVVARDHAAIRFWEAHDFYDIEPAD
jgi:biotin carboxylase